MMMAKGKTTLSEDLIEEIMLRLPLKSVIKFKIVCKRWLSLISQDGFAFRAYTFARPMENPRASYMVLRDHNHHIHKKFITHISVGLTSPRITRKLYRSNCYINSMGVELQVLCPAGLGIYCGFEDRLGVAMLLNPATGDTKVLPPSPFYSSCGVDVFHFGVTDYDASRNKVSWKVGRITSEITSVTKLSQKRLRHQLSLELYSSETNSWKFVPKLSVDDCLGYDNLTTSHCVNLNGRVHWMIGFTKYISSFDYKNMVFEKIEVPKFDYYEFVTRSSIITLFDDKYLCLIVSRGNIVDMWVMREYGVEDSWTKVCTIGPIHDKIVITEVLGYSSKGQCLFVRDLIGLPTRIAIWDWKTSNIEWLHLFGNPQNQFIKIVEHSESLFSLSV